MISLLGAVYIPGAEVEQIDLAPTISLMLGLPVPQNSLGTLIIDALSGLTIRQKLSATYINAQQLLRVLENNVKNYKQGWWVCVGKCCFIIKVLCFSMFDDINVELYDAVIYSVLSQICGFCSYSSIRTIDLNVTFL